MPDFRADPERSSSVFSELGVGAPALLTVEARCSACGAALLWRETKDPGAAGNRERGAEGSSLRAGNAVVVGKRTSPRGCASLWGSLAAGGGGFGFSVSLMPSRLQSRCGVLVLRERCGSAAERSFYRSGSEAAGTGAADGAGSSGRRPNRRSGSPSSRGKR